ncbi:MAG: hypothetical protein WDZ30_10820 [Cellvibrionaceae bacterium]
MNLEELFKSIVWRGIVSIGREMEAFSTWTITGTAAILALLISNLESLGGAVSTSGLKLSLSLFVVSLLAGVFSKQYGNALVTSLRLTDELRSLLDSEPGQDLVANLTIENNKLAQEISKPFWWPLSRTLKKSFLEGAGDQLAAEKRQVRLFCIQLYSNFVHIVTAAFALISLIVFAY